MKISQMILKFASDYISLGKDIEDKQNYLNAACIAWNISNLPENKREIALNKFLEEYKVLNPKATRDDIKDVKHDMDLLITEKLSLFPNVNVAIVNAKIVREGHRDKIIAVSTTFNNG